MMTMVSYPYSNFQDLNLDWILDEIKDLKEQVDTLDERVTALEPAAEIPIDGDEVEAEITPAGDPQEPVDGGEG